MKNPCVAIPTRGHVPAAVVVVEEIKEAKSRKLLRVRCPRCKREFVRHPHGRAEWSGFVWRCHGGDRLHGYYDPAKRTIPKKS